MSQAPYDPYQSYVHDPYAAPAKNSLLGVASLVVAGLSWIMCGLPFAYLFFLGVQSEINETELAEDDPRLMIGGCGVLLGLLMAFVSVGLGIGACFIPQSKKVCAILAIVLGGVLCMGTVFVMLLGLLFA